MPFLYYSPPGQERFQSLGAAFYRGADACVLVFSTTSRASLDHLRTWLDQFIDRCPLPERSDRRNFCWVVVANKVDAVGDRDPDDESTVARDEAAQFVANLMPDIVQNEQRVAENEEEEQEEAANADLSSQSAEEEEESEESQSTPRTSPSIENMSSPPSAKPLDARSGLSDDHSTLRSIDIIGESV
jgi:Ras-related protein Rab-7A